MSIERFSIFADGYLTCNSSFYTVKDVIRAQAFEFTNGLNLLEGDIDSGIFGISYLIGMYDKVCKRLIFSDQKASVDGETVTLAELSHKACYLDESYRLFHSKKTIRQLVRSGLKKSALPFNEDEIREMFAIEPFRFDKSIHAVGNERYQAMAAIGFCHAKEVFAFPWFSRSRYKKFEIRFKKITKVLSEYKKIIILPIGY